MIVRPARSIVRPTNRAAGCPRPTATMRSPSTCTQPSAAQSASPSSTSPLTNSVLTACGGKCVRCVLIDVENRLDRWQAIGQQRPACAGGFDVPHLAQVGPNQNV